MSRCAKCNKEFKDRESFFIGKDNKPYHDYCMEEDNRA